MRVRLAATSWDRWFSRGLPPANLAAGKDPRNGKTLAHGWVLHTTRVIIWCYAEALVWYSAHRHCRPADRQEAQETRDSPVKPISVPALIINRPSRQRWMTR